MWLKGKMDCSLTPSEPPPLHWGRTAAILSVIVGWTMIIKGNAMIEAAGEAPYPPSAVIESVSWAPAEEIMRMATGSDNWPLTWGDDDSLYTAYGDGNGFAPYTPKKLSLGFGRVFGYPPAVRGENILSPSGEQIGDGARGKKASGLLMIRGVLYMLVRNADNAQLAWSEDHGQTWNWCDWRFRESFGCPTFLNFGKNYADARDEYVYIYSPDTDSAYEPADRMVLARVPSHRLTEQGAYEFFKGMNTDGSPIWTKPIEERGNVFAHHARCGRSGITYNAGLRRYLWCQVLPGGDARFQGGFGIYDAPAPWGPWSTAYFTEQWDTGPGETCSFPTKWISGDGRTAILVFSGNDSFSVRKAEFNIATKPPERQTRISIHNQKWHLNGNVAYAGTAAEGLLMNVRMVNSVFEDRRRIDFDAEANTQKFLEALPDYAAHGMRAITLNLQGGMPGYEGALNSAFTEDGALREEYLVRVKRVIEACDRMGMAVILGCYYQRQDQVLRDEAAVQRGVEETARWIQAQGFTNVMLEIANEYAHPGFDHEILRSPEGEAQLIRLARERHPGLLVSTSGMGDGMGSAAIAEAADFILIHFNSTPVNRIAERVEALRAYGKPIVCNEDDKTGETAAAAVELCVKLGISWGYMNSAVNQYFPLEFHGSRDDSLLYSRLKTLTTTP